MSLIRLKFITGAGLFEVSQQALELQRWKLITANNLHIGIGTDGASANIGQYKIKE